MIDAIIVFIHFLLGFGVVKLIMLYKKQIIIQQELERIKMYEQLDLENKIKELNDEKY